MDKLERKVGKMNKIPRFGRWIAASAFMVLKSSVVYGAFSSSAPNRYGFRFRLGTAPLGLGSERALGIYASGQLQRLEAVPEAAVHPLNLSDFRNSLLDTFSPVAPSDFESQFPNKPRIFLGAGLLLAENSSRISENFRLFALEFSKKSPLGISPCHNILVANGYPQNFRVSFQAHTSHFSFRSRGYFRISGEEGLSWKNIHRENWTKFKTDFLLCIKFLQLPASLTPDIRLGGQWKYILEFARQDISGLLEIHTLNQLVSGRLQVSSERVFKFSLQLNLDAFIGAPIKLLPLLN